MKSLRYNVMAAFAVAQLTFVPASAQDARHRGGDSLVYVDRDTTKYVRDGNNQNFSRYDKRIHYYRKGWASLIPTQHVLQFCGNMGLVSGRYWLGLRQAQTMGNPLARGIRAQVRV